jgi:hypothetical protein
MSRQTIARSGTESAAKGTVSRVVCLETPFWSDGADTVARNLRYLGWCIRDCYLNRNEAVYAGHGLGPLGISEPEHRRIGLAADSLARELIRHVVFYLDLGVSPGMLEAAKHCAAHDKPGQNKYEIELRRLPPDYLRLFERGRPPDASVYAIPRQLAATPTPLVYAIPRPPTPLPTFPCWCERCGDLGVDSQGLCMFCGHQHHPQDG